MNGANQPSQRGRRALWALFFLAAAGTGGTAWGQAPAPAAAPPPGGDARPAAEAPSSQWQELRPFVVERVFRGPLRDTLVQRLRDPVDGSTCFIYLPMSAAVAAQGQFLVYGPNAIGSISCFGPAHVIQLQQAPAPSAAQPQPAAPAAPPRPR